jgi:hypothetical protein
MSHLPKPQLPVRKLRAAVARTLALVVVVLLVATAAPASASMTKTRIMERDGKTLIVSQDVGDQAFPIQWVEHDERRLRDAQDGLTLSYRIDLTELPPGVSKTATEEAIESAVDTFNRVQCAKNLKLVRVDDDPENEDRDFGYAQNHFLGPDGGGEEWDEPSPNATADITFAGWVPPAFFTAAGADGSLGLTVPLARDADGSIVWGFDVLDPTRDLTDIDADGNADVIAMELYFTTDLRFDYITNDPNEDELFSIDVESIALHELGHALGMDHFGRSTVILDENGDFVDLIVNPNSVNLMNTSNYFGKRDLSGSDIGSFCGIYATWGKGPAGSG